MRGPGVVALQSVAHPNEFLAIRDSKLTTVRASCEKPSTIVHDCSPWFSARNWFACTVSSERACQEEQNGTSFSSIALSSEELWVQKEI